MMRRPTCLFVIMMFLAGMAILPGTPSPIAQAAQVSGPSQAHQLEIAPARLRTLDEMMADQAAHPLAPGAPQAIPFRPGMDPEAYAAAKKALAAVAAASPALKPSLPAAPANPALLILNCDGEDQASAAGYGFQWFPPDADGAFGYSPSAGTLEFAQTTNVHFTVWDALKATSNCARSNSLLMDVTLASFFGYFTEFLGDGRIVHDDTYSRWVVSALAFPAEPTGADYEFIAVSVSDDARGPYFIYQFDTTQITCFGCFWDFQQLGMDDASIILTANIFPSTSLPFSSRWVFANKQHLYYGLGLTSCYFNDPLPSWAPPKVLDLSPLTWMVEAQPVANFLQVASVSGTGSVCPRIVNYASVGVPAYSFARSANQPGTTNVLDTLDGRFQNRSTQVGNVVWNVHTTSQFASFPTPTLRRINTVGLTAQTAFFFASSTSDDFNPSVAANLGNSIAVSWSSTDAPSGLNAQVRAGRCSGAFGVCSPSSGTLVFQSATSYALFRWGDYSYATIDGSGTIAAGVNEYIQDGTTWRTRYYAGIFP